MKRLNFLDKFLFFINSMVAALLLLTYLIPYIDPEQLSIIAVLSLAYPSLLILNIVFVLLWLLKLKPQILLSLIIIAFGFNHTKALFSFQKKEITTPNELKILSFNVRQFNLYNWIKSETIKKDIGDFIDKQNPDIVCLQEYKNTKNVNLKLPYKYVFNRSSSALAIYSKFPISNKGSLDFVNSHNNSIYIDIKINSKTVRIYNIHLQSFSLDTQKENFGKGDKKQLLKIFKNVFKKQAQQIKMIKNHIKECQHSTIMAGDFNNTAFSWNYKQLTQNHKDAFVEAGNGFGQSYKHLIPFRIDFILPQNNMEVNMFTTFKENLSDHYPIMATININN